MHNNWLPWRYTFRVKDASFRKAFIRSARQNGLKVSSLYQPILKHLDKNPEVYALYPAAEAWSSEAVNLVYDYNRESTRALSNNIRKTLSTL